MTAATGDLSSGGLVPQGGAKIIVKGPAKAPTSTKKTDGDDSTRKKKRKAPYQKTATQALDDFGNIPEGSVPANSKAGRKTIPPAVRKSRKGKKRAVAMEALTQVIFIEDDDDVVCLDVPAAERHDAAKSGQAMPDGSFPIRNKKELQAAIRLNGRSKNYKRSQIRAHIKSRAAALGLSSLIPDGWATQEGTLSKKNKKVVTQEALIATLVFDNVAKQPTIVQDEAVNLPNGVMRIRAPFYIGGSVSNAPGFNRKIIWQESALPKIIEQAKAKLTLGQQPITSYARHAHALAGDDLPVAKVVGVEQEGNVGYATLDIYPVEPRGKHVQTLVQAGALNAMSLRSRDFKLVRGKLDGEDVLLCEELDLQGLDFAPDGPAQPTYGIQQLTQEAVIEVIGEVVEQEDDEPHQEHNNLSKEKKVADESAITAERVRTEAPEVVAEIEAPLRKQVTELEAKYKALVLENSRRERDAAIERYATEFSRNPEEFRSELVALCEERGINDAAGVDAVVTPLLMQELKRLSNAQVADAAPKSRQEKLAELFGVSPAPTATASGVGISQESTPAVAVTEHALVQEASTGESVVGGLLVPEDF